MTRPRLADLYCCEGGAARGYHRAGFDVTGVDVKPQPRYPYPFVLADALVYLAEHGRRFDAVHASPPCQLHSAGTRYRDRSDYPDLIAPTRAALVDLGKPYVIENVEGAPVAGLTLCGTEFGLTALDVDGRTVALRRHRVFESNVFLWGAGGCQCGTWAGRIAGVYGAGSSTPAKAKVRHGGYTPTAPVAAALLGVEGMTRYGMTQAIPPAYTAFIGDQLLAYLAGA